MCRQADAARIRSGARRHRHSSWAIGFPARTSLLPERFEAEVSRRTDPSSPAWSRTGDSNALGTQQVAAPSPVQRRVRRPQIHSVKVNLCNGPRDQGGQTSSHEYVRYQKPPEESVAARGCWRELRHEPAEHVRFRSESAKYTTPRV